MSKRVLLVTILTFLCGLTGYAQEAAQRAETLRQQLSVIQAKEAELQTRAQQLDEELKPENIERSLALVGSTHPEDLREQRRRQLEIEKKGVTAQLEQLSASRARLESAIARSDAEAYRQSAEIVKPASNRNINTTPVAKKKKQTRKRRRVRQ